MRKTVHIKLKHYQRVDPTGASYPSHQIECYAIEGLRNAAQVSVGAKSFRVKDYLTPEEADRLCEVKHYDVTIS